LSKPFGFGYAFVFAFTGEYRLSAIVNLHSSIVVQMVV
jgi:hypothetical protein